MKFYLKMIVSGLILVFPLHLCVGQVNQTGQKETDLIIAPGELTITQIKYEGLTRDYRYYIPNNFDIEKKHPLILVLHGANQPIESMVIIFEPAHADADKDGTVIVYPIGSGSIEESNLGWNIMYDNSGETDQVDDIGYLTFLMDLFIEKLNCDPDRIYVVGASNGGAITYTLSCFVPDRLAAIAPLVMHTGVNLIKQFQDAKPLPVMMVTGTADPYVPQSGYGNEFGAASMVDNIHYWKNRNHITSTAVVTDLPDLCTEITDGVETPSRIQKYVWESTDGNEIIWLNVINGGHWLPTYAGGNPIDPSTFGVLHMGTWNCDFNGAGAVYQFLLSHERQ